MTNKVIGRNLKQIRINSGVTQEMVSDFLSITQSALSRIESGDQRLLAADLYSIAKLLKVEINEFFKK